MDFRWPCVGSLGAQILRWSPWPEPLRLRSGQACRMDQDDNVGNKMDGR
jgi:hypothetical protein